MNCHSSLNHHSFFGPWNDLRHFSISDYESQESSEKSPYQSHSFYRWKNWGPERSREWLQVTLLVCSVPESPPWSLYSNSFLRVALPLQRIKLLTYGTIMSCCMSKSLVTQLAFLSFTHHLLSCILSTWVPQHSRIWGFSETSRKCLKGRSTGAG